MKRMRVVAGCFPFLLMAASIVPRMGLNAASAQVKPGDVITPDNAARVKDLLPPGSYWRAVNGMVMKITSSDRIDWPPPYKEATEKYSAQVRLTDDHRSLVGYVAGQPFPLLDPNDPDVATKIMWNNAFRPMWTDDVDARFFGCSSIYEGLHNPNKEIDFTLVGHYMIYNEVGRTEVDPIPIDPDFKITGRYFLMALHPVLAPAAAKGAGLIRYRYAKPTKGDDFWFFNPGQHRVRRFSEVMGSEGGTNQFYPDDYEGFSAKNENYNWKFLGEKQMLGSVNGSVVPGPVCPNDGGGSVCPAEWQMRHVYIVEGTARRERMSEDLYSKHVVFVDSEIDAVLEHDSYDQRGELYHAFTNWLTYRDRTVPEARIAIYPFKRVFQVNGTSTDVQSGLSQFCDLPTPNAPEKECWYINMGAVHLPDFSVDAMVRDAQR